ncbi:uncharacterized protein EV422DRAFT_218107 [Fimicolochytrium jonesii]|uniref:uncharacterized protein n=1 Tax=Fimicolochytrium jonesii TaxID=1396493 RepID=UPI0022FE15FD|nr:uncharacterized protein EV422DRAFT_218107 [Fimicolochytrium jonesii]KAI8817560.1 hypothetical protein EV422DRAFT_218107 [Fimicolochytrium jonesii]
MFYTFEEEQFSELDLFEEAASVVSVGPNQESALQACISLSSPTIANYHAKREQSKPHDRDPEKYFKETGYSALLQYVISSKGAHSEVIVPLCLECLDLLQVIVNEEVAGFEDYALIETFVDQTAHRLLTVAELSQNVRKEILDVIWGWATGFVELVIRNQSAWKFQCGLAGLAGVLAALIKSRADFQRSYMVTLTEITAALLDFGPFKFLHGEGEPHYSAWSASGGFERAVYKVFHNLFEFGKILLLSMLEIDGQKSATQSAQWEGLLDAESRISTANGEEQVAIRTLYGLCWRLYSHRTANLEADDVQAEEIKTLLPAVVKCGILCTMHVDDLKQNLLGHVSGILTKHNAFFSPALVITCLESLTLVIDHVPALKPTVIETLLSFICLPSPVFLEWHHDSNSCAALRQCVGYLLLQNLKGTDGKDAIISVKAKCITIMSGQPLDGDGKKGWLTPQQKKMAQVNCTVAVATISVLLSEEETVDVVKRGFEGPLGDPSFKDHDVFWDSLGNIGLNSGVQLLSSIYGLYKKHRTVKSTRIRQILAREAAKSADSAATFLEDTLKAFTECASGMREKDASALKDLYDHAWVASILCEDVEFHKRDQNIVETNFIFRDFWLCAIARLLGQDGKWPAGWAGILQAIALKTPCFALSSQERFLEEDLRTQSVMEKIVGAEVQQRVRTCLQTAFTERYSASKTLSFAKCTYLLAVREVERFKAKNLAPLTILKYLNHDRLYNDEVYDFLLSIGDDVIGVFIRACSLKKDVPPPLIADQLKQLLFMAASRLERARAFAANSVYRILRAFPALVWHRKSVGLMLDLLQCLDTESQPSATRTETLRGKIGRKLDLLNEYDVQAASQDFFDFCVRWTKLAFQRSASETVGLIQGYMVDIQTNFPELAIGEKSQLVTLLGRFCSSEDIAAMIIKSVGKHALYYGEVRGMLKAGYQTGRDQKAVQERVAKDLCRELRSVVSAPKHPQFALNLHPALHRAAAMALLMDGGEDELLELICWTPITVFTPAVMDMAISVWSLLMSARAELGARVMGYLVAVWETTAMERKGLYRTMTRSANPFYSKMTYTPSKPSQDTLSDSQALSIHLSWIRFLLDRFKSARVQSVDHVKFFCKLYYIAHEHATSIK